jgi:LmbE family N-acetylglucosaminyl deacetylase
MYNRVLVVAAHPDDETLGAGGTIARLVREGAEVIVLFIATGVESVEPGNHRELEASRALGQLGVGHVGFCRYPDQRLDDFPILEITQDIEPTIKRARPELVITHHVGDCNMDHAITHRAVMVATRPKPGSSVKEVWAMEVLSSTEWGFGQAPFVPNLYVDITDTLDRKLEALHCYETALEKWPHPRGAGGLSFKARSRGSEAGIEAAEAFMILRRTL